MKPSHISVATLVVSLLFALTLLAQSPDSANQNGASRAASAAEVPRLIKFSGTLLDAQERPLAGPLGVTFALYSRQAGGAALWMETQNVKADGNGNYTILLGANSTNGVPAELFVSGEARWLGIQVGQQPEHDRILLVSVPYALKAGDAETLGGLPASAFVTNGTPGNTGHAGGGAAATSSSSTALPTASTPKKAASTPQPATPCSSVTSDGTGAVNSIALFSTACNVESSVITQSSGNVGIGTATPTVAVDIAGNNAGLRLSGTGTHQVTVTGASSGRLGQDATGFFFSSDTNGKVVKFLTNNGTLNEWMRITSAGNVGIGTTTPAARLDVNGQFHVGTGNAWFRVDGPPVGTASPFLASWGGSGDFAIDAPNVLGGRFIVKDSGNVGIGVPNPTSKLQVSVASTGGIGVFGVATAASGGATGVFGQSASTSGTGVFGDAIATSGSATGVEGQSASTGGTGVFGDATATSGTTHGVSGQSVSTSGAGVFGIATATSGTASGVEGHSASTTGTGVLGNATATSGSTTGVYGQVASASGTAGVLNNTASGNIVIGQAAGANKFRVDGSGNVFLQGNTSFATGGDGVIFKSPDGTKCVKVSIDNTPTVVFTPVTCPAAP